VHIDTTSSLESFRWFLINSTCMSFIPEGYLRDPEVFPEKEGDAGAIYVEAADKVTLKKIRMINFINARDVLGIIYTSKSGNTHLRWRQTREKTGRVIGEASGNSLVNLLAARVITKDYADELANIKPQEEEGEEQDEEQRRRKESIEEEAWMLDEDDQDSSTSEIPGLEGSLQTADDV
jgi:hypothetical protein